MSWKWNSRELIELTLDPNSSESTVESSNSYHNIVKPYDNMFKSVDHRVLTNREGPRISVACFLTGVAMPAIVYTPIKELLSE
ncbi:hypothetical protein LguiA_000682 [Lonicera macranthoides]